ncbi:phosphoribosylformylglycinamidine synthase subunit PurQ [Sesbania bispinosa]|nr:phosphoribosylformylglycinamidine synthase subunit PurQ [Sesbania bispinosa]
MVSIYHNKQWEAYSSGGHVNDMFDVSKKGFFECMKSLENSDGNGYVDDLNLDKPPDELMGKGPNNSGANGVGPSVNVEGILPKDSTHIGGVPHPRSS